jgi:hypothetical protein
MNLKTNLLTVFLVVLVFSLDIFAVTVDYYQNCENGNAGNSLTSTIMNGSGHGFGAWSAPGGSMWVSNNNSRQLPGTVTVGGTTYTDTGNRTWAVNDNMDRNFVRIDIDDGTTHADVNVACYMTPGPIVYVYNNFDNIVISNFYYAVLQFINPGVGGPWIRGHGCDSNWATTITDNIKIEFQKTYWINLYYKGTTEMMYVAVFDPDTWEQVGNTVSCHTAYQSFTNALYVDFGRSDAHGDNLNATTQTTFEDILIDYTNPPFPLLPDTGEPPPPDTTPPDNISTVNDGIGNDIDSTLSTTQLSANWTAATDNESSITNYHYAIGLTPGGSNTAAWTTLGNVLTVTKTDLTLTIGTTYYFSVKAQSAGGTSNATNSDGQFVADGGSPALVISNVGAVDITETGARITWNTNEPATSQVQHGFSSSYGDVTVENSNLVTSHSVELSGLTAGREYHYSVISKDSSDNERISVDYTFTTQGGTFPDTTPPVISDVNAVNIVMMGATITWDTDEPATSRVQYGATAIYGNSTLEDSNLVTGHSVNITDLIPGIEYHYRVISKDSSGNEKISIDYTFKTSGDEIAVRTYPNPYSPSRGSSMRFSIDGTSGGEVKIYTLSGKLVKELVIQSGESEVNWDVLNEEGNGITTGLYLYTIIDGEGNKKTGKLAITQ